MLLKHTKTAMAPKKAGSGKRAKKSTSMPDPEPNPSPNASANDNESTTFNAETEQIVQKEVNHDVVPKKKTKAKLCQLISEEEEAHHADWLKENPCLYNNGLKEYRYAGRMSHLWEDKATSLKGGKPRC